MLGAAFFFSLMAAFVKLIGPRIPTQEVVLVRAVILLVLSAGALKARRRPLLGTRHGLLVLRGVLGLIALFCFFAAVVRLPLADVTVLQYTSPVFTAFIAAVVLGERMGSREVAFAALSLAGVVLVARPSFLFGEASLDPFWVLVAVLGALFTSGAYVAVRRVAAHEDPMTIVLYFAAVSVLGSLPLVIPTWVSPTALEWGWLLGMGLATQLGQVLLTRGLKAAPAGRAVAVGYIQIAFAALWGWLIFSELPDGIGMVGTGVIMLGTYGLMRTRAGTAGAVAQSRAAR
jgi:drug/metabolite transporter (DMT)-like permease